MFVKVFDSTCMHRFLVLIVLLTNTLVAFAQNGVKGRVLEADGTPVIYAAVVLESAGKTVAGAMTGEEGTFLIQGAFNGQYLLKISSIGYKDLKREISCTGKGMLDLGDIILAQDATVLDEALVVAGDTPKNVSVTVIPQVRTYTRY